MLSALSSLAPREDPDFDRLTGLASALLDTPVALVSMVDVDRQWFKARRGTEMRETPVEISFCAHAIEAKEGVMVVPDATQDPRFSANPLVTGDMHLRFYAGAAITVHGERV
ncbi:MAG: GAF domain-containing protein, partial [Rhizobiaceae bacterium]|nr:GAF domain-containing protein [Rhizobiaceae bacterium]